MMKRLLQPLLLGGIAATLLVCSCTPDSGISPAESDVVATNYKKNVDFGAITTWAMPDSILHISADSITGDDSKLSRANDAFILGEITRHMNDRDYQQVEVSEDTLADVVLLVAATSTAYYGLYYPYYPGWGWWGGWGYYPGWGPGYGGYYPPTPTYSYTTGTLIVSMVDPSEVDIEEKVFAIQWVGTLNGVLDDSSSGIRNRLSNQIAQMFNQSPYLRKKS